MIESAFEKKQGGTGIPPPLPGILFNSLKLYVHKISPFFAARIPHIFSAL